MKTPKEHKELLKLREGFVGNVYNDSRNNPTIGYGHKVKEGENFTTLTEEQANELFMQDYLNAQQGADRIIKEFNIPTTGNVRDAITGAVFQLGETGFKKHKKTIALLQQGNLEGAAKEAKNSDWHKQTPVRTEDFGNTLLNRQKGGFINMQEGGDVVTDVTPDVTSQVLPNTMVQATGFVKTEKPKVDKTQGFYSVNPAPDETAEEFYQRTASQFEPPVTKPKNQGSFRPPAGYVSPRESDFSLFSSSSGSTSSGGGSGGGSGDTKVQTNLTFPKNNNLSASQQSAITLLGISNDVVAAESAKMGGNYGALNETFITDYLNDYFGVNNFGPIDLSTSFTGIYGLDDTFTDAVNVELQKEFVRYDVKTLDELTVKLGADASKAILDGAINIAKTNDIIKEISNVKLDTTFTYGSKTSLLRNEDGTLIRKPATEGSIGVAKTYGEGAGLEIDILEDKDFSNLYKESIDAEGNTVYTPIYTMESMLAESTSEYMSAWAESLTPDEKDILIGSNTSTTKWFDTISDKTIGNMYGHEIQVKDLYDEFASAFFVGYLTEDWGKAAIAGGTQFLKTDFVKGFSSKIGSEAAKGFSSQIAGATTVAEVNAAFKAGQKVDYDLVSEGTDLAVAKQTATDAVSAQSSAKFELYAGTGMSMLQAWAMGGDTEDVIWAGAEYAITDIGAAPLGEFLGVTSAPGLDGKFAAQEGVGGAVISGLITLARTGDLGQAAVSAGTSYLFAVNPVLGTLAMAAQFVMGTQEPKNYASYTSVNLDDMTTQSFSQGDVDPSKASPENTAFTRQVVDNIMPLLVPITEAYDVKQWLGDVEIQYGNRDGLFLTIVNKDITGFTNRADYNEEEGDLGRNDVYQRRFNTFEELQEHFLEIMTFAAEHMRDENGVVDLGNILGARTIYHSNKFRDYVEENDIQLSNYAGSGMGIVDFAAMDTVQDTYSQNTKQGGKISLDKGGNVQYNKGNYGLVNKKGKAPPSARADDVPMTLKEGDFVLSQPAVALYGKDTIDRMLSRAATDAGKNLKSGGKVPVNVHNGEYIIPKNLTEYIGPNVLETMNNRGLMSVGERPNT
tara:strand:- start:287 stop:3502 length:3216 start_codon:yes stop_codon:yes gene_type:complete